MNETWCVVLTRNNLQLTQKAIDSLRNQTLPTRILVVDNCSTDSTAQWLASQQDIFTIFNVPANSVAGAWNQALKWIFYSRKASLAVVCNNDIVARPDAIMHLIADGGGFVTCVGSDDPEKIEPTELGAYQQEFMIDDKANISSRIRPSQPYLPPDPSKKRPHPDYSFFLIRKWVFEKVGPFNEDFKGAYCEDSDHHLRMHRAGIKAEALELPFLHIGGGAATVKNADDKERKRIQVQADKNRALFKSIYGFEVGSPAYYEAFGHGSPD